MTDDETRDPATVFAVASDLKIEEWATWHPDDGTQYRVKVVRIVGGPEHTDAVLLVNVTSALVAVKFTPKWAHAEYRSQRWNHQRWKREQLNPKGAYDWWPKVIKPLLQAAGVA